MAKIDELRSRIDALKGLLPTVDETTATRLEEQIEDLRFQFNKLARRMADNRTRMAELREARKTGIGPFGNIPLHVLQGAALAAREDEDREADRLLRKAALAEGHAAVVERNSADRVAWDRVRAKREAWEQAEKVLPEVRGCIRRSNREGADQYELSMAYRLPVSVIREIITNDEYRND